MDINVAFWRGKRALVTGHTGFKGSWLTLWLKTLDAQVEGIALAPATQPNLYRLAVAPELPPDPWTDVRDSKAVARLLTSFQPEVIFHLAAQSIVRVSYDDPLATFATNVMGTANVLDGARSVPGLRAVVVVTSDKCYANEPSSQAFKESSALGANDPYSGSKACAAQRIGAPVPTGLLGNLQNRSFSANLRYRGKDRWIVVPRTRMVSQYRVGRQSPPVAPRLLLAAPGRNSIAWTSVLRLYRGTFRILGRVRALSRCLAEKAAAHQPDERPGTHANPGSHSLALLRARIRSRCDQFLHRHRTRAAGCLDSRCTGTQHGKTAPAQH
ncbi:MAG: NAD-dependent epimerase/dehydratase family protein [Betaproteobacteria bacterium]|nr:NAD-dependent epimerase/dehydratase family protein [Betaproteobacteria bacterium]